MKPRSLAILALLAAGALAACNSEEPQQPTGTAARPPAETSSAAPTLPDTLFLTAAPQGAKDVKAAKPEIKVGDEVVLQGRIGGREEPFVDGRAVFVLMDNALPACSDNPDDACATPWDYCCESPADVAAHAATIRVLGPDGQPLKTGLKGANGLEPLAKVTVVGKVAERDEAGNLVVDATGLYVSQG